ncbi:hypothetical protein [Pleionea sediminis]|uniref:hypothetical protein n=1 Tax=Pleionea sediminis TaxID=2569479 RepID=UPI00197BCA65|nr:hypothetical protein [Pleionea sediminis]
MISLAFFLVTLRAKEYIGLSIGGDIEGSDTYSSIVELNYAGRYNSNVSTYLGWAWRNVPGRELLVEGETKFQLRGSHAGFQVHPDIRFARPFIGLGVYSAIIRLCDLNDSTQCENDTTWAIYPEAGIHFAPLKNVELTIKVRKYQFERRYLQDDTLLSAHFSFYMN